MKLVCIGDNVADIYLDKKTLYPGGSTYNVAVLAHRLGMETGYMGPLGNDQKGRHLLKVLEEEGVDTSRIEIRKGSNAYSQVKLINGERIFVKIDKGIYRDINLENRDLEYINDFDILHSTVYSYTEKYLKVIREMGLTISYDFSFKTDIDYIKKTAPYVDLAFFSEAGIEGDKRQFMRRVFELGPDYVVVTLGDRGALVFHQGYFLHQTARKIEVIDTLGAGDAFIAGFLNSWQKGLPLAEVMKEANLVAGEVCTYYGAVGHGLQMG